MGFTGTCQGYDGMSYRCLGIVSHHRVSLNNIFTWGTTSLPPIEELNSILDALLKELYQC